MTSHSTSSPIIEPKRKKGRPRQQESADPAEQRRRAQLRTAQRAYRMRKTQTLESLKAQNTELEEKIERLSEVFMGLADTAIESATLSKQTATVTQLKESIQKLLGVLHLDSPNEPTKDMQPSPTNDEGMPEIPSEDALSKAFDVPLPEILTPPSDFESSMRGALQSWSRSSEPPPYENVLSTNFTSQDALLPFGYPVTLQSYFQPGGWSFVAQLLWTGMTGVYRSLRNEAGYPLTHVFKVFNKTPSRRALDDLLVRCTRILRTVSVDQELSDGLHIDLGIGHFPSPGTGQRVYYNANKLLAYANEMDCRIKHPTEYLSAVRVFQYLRERGAFDSNALMPSDNFDELGHSTLQTCIRYKPEYSSDWKTVVVSIPALISELSKHMVCIDNSPNFPIKSVDASIEKAVVAVC